MEPLTEKIIHLNDRESRNEKKKNQKNAKKRDGNLDW
jgi:hypothetical protein